jgi:hypothetical protein
LPSENCSGLAWFPTTPQPQEMSPDE